MEYQLHPFRSADGKLLFRGMSTLAGIVFYPFRDESSGHSAIRLRGVCPTSGEEVVAWPFRTADGRLMAYTIGCDQGTPVEGCMQCDPGFVTGETEYATLAISGAAGSISHRTGDGNSVRSWRRVVDLSAINRMGWIGACGAELMFSAYGGTTQTAQPSGCKRFIYECILNENFLTGQVRPWVVVFVSAWASRIGTQAVYHANLTIEFNVAAWSWFAWAVYEAKVDNVCSEGVPASVTLGIVDSWVDDDFGDSTDFLAWADGCAGSNSDPALIANVTFPSLTWSFAGTPENIDELMDHSWDDPDGPGEPEVCMCRDHPLQEYHEVVCHSVETRVCPPDTECDNQEECLE